MKKEGIPVKNIWIINHYATKQYIQKGGRHYWIGKELMRKGYKPTIITASTVHNDDSIEMNENKYKVLYEDGITWVFVKTNEYSKNDHNRVMNMINFYRRTKSINSRSLNIEKPDIILGSSVHPLAILAAIKLSKKYNCKSIGEVRDLWPESLIAYNIISAKNPLARFLYSLEKYLYENVDHIIMTWPGGASYIVEKNWSNSIPLSKVTHISNGIDLEQFDKNLKNNILDDSFEKNNFSVVYTGTISQVNNLSFIIDVAKKIDDQEIQFFIFGKGTEYDGLSSYVKKEKINNITFKGKVDKAFVPSILEKADLLLLHNQSTLLNKYGQSQNKQFEYLASGTPILQTYSTNFNIIEQNKCGIMLEEQTVNNTVTAIKKLKNKPHTMVLMGKNARQTAIEYDFSKLTDRLISVVESL